MSDVTWLDHDFAPVPPTSPRGLMFVGNVLDVDVFCVTDLDAGSSHETPAASDSATGDPDPTRPRSGSPARAVDQRKAELLEELVDVLLSKPSQFYSYLIGELRRHHASTLSELPVDVLRSVVGRALTLHGARGGR